MRRCRLLTLCVLVCAVCAAARADGRPKVGLALSGGGARGVAHVGVLQILEEMQIPVDYVAGTSMGAVVGGLYCAGWNPTRLDSVARALDWLDLLSDEPDRREVGNRRKADDSDLLIDFEMGFDADGIHLPSGIVAGQKMDFLLKTMLVHTADAADFNHLNIPFRAVATNVSDGSLVVMGDGDLASAIRASMSIPGALSPVERDGRLLVDGGMVQNLPVETVIDMGADVVIAVNVGTPVMSRDDIRSAFDISLQSMLILTEDNVMRSIAALDSDDVLVTPDLKRITSSDFEQAGEAISLGRAAAQRATDHLSRYSVSTEEYGLFRERQGRMPRDPLMVDNIQVQGTEHVPPQYIIERLETRAGAPLDVEVLERDLMTLYELGDFERVEFTVRHVDGANILLIEAVEKSWGPNYLRFGIELADDFQGGSYYNLKVHMTHTWINRFGAEWRNAFQIGRDRRFETEFYQPLSYQDTWFIAPGAWWEQTVHNAYDSTQVRLGQFHINLGVWALGIGRQFGKWGEARVSLQHGSGTGELFIGRIEGWDAEKITQTAVNISVVYDQINRPYLPTEGTILSSELFISRKEWGSRDSYQMLSISGTHAHTYRDYTGLWSFETVFPVFSTLPYYTEASLGGLFSLSGYRQGQIFGKYAAVGRLVFFRRLREIARPIYFGFSAEGGNAWMSRNAISLTDIRIAGSVWLAADTIVGPLYLAYGVAHALNDPPQKGWSRGAYLMLGVSPGQ